MSKDLISNTMRLTAFHSIVNSICYANLEFSKKVNKAFYRAIEDNSEKITKLVIRGISKLENKNINYAMIQKLCDLRTYNDEQLLCLLKVIRDFVKDNYMNYPDEVLKLWVNESSNNPNQNIRIDALNILKQIKDKGGDLPDKVTNHIDFECNLQKLKESTDTKEITKILKSLLNMDFKSTSISFSTLDAVAYLFSNEDSDVYVKYILRFISRVIAENIPVTHQFIDWVTMYCSKYQDNQEYIKIIKDLIHKYDQYCNSDILQNALKGIRKSATEENKKMWIQILVDLSNRNVKFTSEYLIKLLNWASDGEDILFDVIKNAVGNIDKISESLIERLEDMLISETHQTKVLEILAQATRNGVHLKDDIILLLLKISQSDSDDKKYIYEIFVNLSKNNCKLPEAATHLGELISQINIIKSKDQSLTKINEAVVKIVEIDNISDLSPFISYESLLMHLENLIKDHKNSQLSLIWMKSIDYFCQKNPSLLGHLNWNLISSCVKYSEFNKVLFKLFEKGANSKVKFPRGALSKLTESGNKGIHLALLNHFYYISVRLFAELHLYFRSSNWVAPESKWIFEVFKRG